MLTEVLPSAVDGPGLGVEILGPFTEEGRVKPPPTPAPIPVPNPTPSFETGPLYLFLSSAKAEAGGGRRQRCDSFLLMQFLQGIFLSHLTFLLEHWIQTVLSLTLGRLGCLWLFELAIFQVVFNCDGELPFSKPLQQENTPIIWPIHLFKSDL
ncbi:unnamed protein product [Ambrosiozyma monospora]|uniref:Unnamed protein product n=1 Tax=Ambrosiozyma monospora TaxID=43982 RepID=A0ACB5U3F3_AMBMO|nr:unnamed protein product [Ambrosiozyma monospora]